MDEEMDWGYASGAVAVLETFLVAPGALAELAGTADSVDAILSRALRSPVYEGIQGSEIKDPNSAADAVEAAVVGYIRAFVSCCPSPAVAEPFLLEHDMRDLANRLKAEHSGVERNRVELARVPEDGIEDWLADRPRLKAVARELDEAGEQVPPDRIDRLLDGAFIAMLPELTEPLGSALIDRWARQNQEHRALLAVLRARRAGVEPDEIRLALLRDVPNGDELAGLAEADDSELGRMLAGHVPPDAIEEFDPQAGGTAIQALEDRLDAELAATLEPARYVPFGPERVLSYMWRLFQEDRNLRAVLGGLAGEIGPDLTRAALRGVHG